MLPVQLVGAFRIGIDGELIVPAHVASIGPVQVCFARETLPTLFEISASRADVLAAAAGKADAIRQAAHNVLDAQGREKLKTAARVWVRGNGYFVE